MIFITGDTHGEWVRRLSSKSFKEQKIGLGKNDIVIICGDFGLWHDTPEERWNLKWLEEKSFTTVFIDGNHSNFDRLYSYPVKEWNGGKVHEIRPSVLHLMRGEVFEIEGKKFFVFGGASSHDISDGIIEKDEEGKWCKKAKFYDKQRKNYRIRGLSWWEEELPSGEEMKNGIENLKKSNNKVDFIVTHSPSADVIDLLNKDKNTYPQDRLTEYLKDIKENIEYSKWFCGHIHIDKKVSDKDFILYEKIVRIV